MVFAAEGGKRASDFSESGFPRWGKPDVPAEAQPREGLREVKISGVPRFKVVKHGKLGIIFAWW